MPNHVDREKARRAKAGKERMKDQIASGELKVRQATKRERTSFAQIRAQRMRDGYYDEIPTDLYERDLELLT